MIRIISKDNIQKYILPYLSRAKRGKTKTNLWEIVNAILYKFRTGVQWRHLPMKSLIYRSKIKYGAVYYHFRKWTLDGSWEAAQQGILRQYRGLVDMSVCQLDGTHTPAKRGGNQVSYQGWKKVKTTNTLWLTSLSGLPLGFTSPLKGNHHDVFNCENRMNLLAQRLEKSKIQIEGLIVNADAGFDYTPFRRTCETLGLFLNAPIKAQKNRWLTDSDIYFDEELYKKRYVVERTNAWMDANRTLLVRHDTSIESWTAWHHIFCISQWVRFLTKV